MTGRLKAAILLMVLAIAMAAGYFAYQRKVSNTREALLEKSIVLAEEGYYADAARAIDKAIAAKDDGSCSDAALFLKKADVFLLILCLACSVYGTALISSAPSGTHTRRVIFTFSS